MPIRVNIFKEHDIETLDDVMPGNPYPIYDHNPSNPQLLLITCAEDENGGWVEVADTNSVKVVQDGNGFKLTFQSPGEIFTILEAEGSHYHDMVDSDGSLVLLALKHYISE